LHQQAEKRLFGGTLHSKNVALLPVAALIITILATLIFGFSEKIFFNPPNLVFALNLIFWSIATFSIAYISAKSFLKEGSAIVLIISCSIIILGLSLIISGWVTNFSGNYSVAIANIGILIASALQVLCGVLFLTGKTEAKIKGIKALASVYFATVVFVLGVSAFVLLGFTPVFYNASGPTLLRQGVLGLGIVLFAVACILYIRQYLKSKAPSLYWYALAIGVFSISLSSTFEVKALGDLPTWLGRIGLYIGTIYLIAAILLPDRKSSRVDLASAWAGAFKANSEQFEALFSNMLDAFVYGKIVVDKEGKPVDWVFLDVNDSYGRISGLSIEQILGKRVNELYPEERNDPIDWIGKYGHVALTGEPVHFEGYRQTLKKWLHVSSYSPKKGYFIAIFEDITERKKAEEALKQSELRYRQLFNSMTEMFQVIELIFDKDGKAIDYYYRDVNPAFEKLVRKTREQLIGKRVKAIFGIVEDYWLEAYDGVAKTGNSAHFENYGAELEKWYDVYVWKANDKQVAITFTDITERKKAEDALKKSELKFKTLAENAPDPIMRFDPNLRITYLNPSDLALAGLTLEDAIGKTNEELGMPVELCKLWNNTFDRAKITKQVQQVEFSFNSVTGAKIFDLRIVPEFAEDGSLTSFMGISHDITGQKKAEQELENHRNHLEKVVEEKTNQLKDSERLAAIGATAGMVGHDIRNPLQAITGDVYLAKAELAAIPESAEKIAIQESVDEIEKNVEYINKIVQDLQDYARPLNPMDEKADLTSIIEKLFAKKDIPKNVKVTIKVDDAAKKIKADSYYINRIMYNLVTNAVQAMPKGGKLLIQAQKDAGDIVISVKDTGVGIPKNLEPKLFTPMFTTKSKGQGFGLPVVKRMTESLGGTVSFESEEGIGTTFTIRLPQSS
jgi:PAS domain S-box-containing protein